MLLSSLRFVKFNVCPHQLFHPQALVLVAKRHVTYSGNLPLATRIHLTLSQDVPSVLGNLSLLREGSRWLPVSSSLSAVNLCLLQGQVECCQCKVFSYLQVRGSVCIAGSSQKFASCPLGSMYCSLCFRTRCFYSFYSSYVLSRSLAPAPLFFIIFIILNRERPFDAQACPLLL